MLPVGSYSPNELRRHQLDEFPTNLGDANVSIDSSLATWAHAWTSRWEAGAGRGFVHHSRFNNIHEFQRQDAACNGSDARMLLGSDRVSVSGALMGGALG